MTIRQARGREARGTAAASQPGRPDTRTRLGLLGGTFDPFHLGHLLVAEDVRRQLRLDRVVFLPACRPPHRPRPVAAYEQRREMTRLATEGIPGFELLSLEEGRPGPSYTVDTLAGLRAVYPSASLHFLLGADQYRDVSTWHRPELLTRLARLVVMTRPGLKRPARFRGHDPARVRFCAVIPVAISAAMVRARLASGLSVRYMLPLAVHEFVARYRLYRRCP